MTTNSGSQGESAGPGGNAPASPNRRAFVKAAAAAGAVAAVAGAAGLMITASPEEHLAAPPSRRIRALKTSGPVPREPDDLAWRSVTPMTVPLLAQNMATPRVLVPTIASMGLRILHSNDEIGFHLQWADNAVDDVEALGRFRDSVAVELPVDPHQNTNVMMGQAGRPVHILHWRSSWQAELTTGARTVQRAYPNVYSEVTPESVLGEEAARNYYPALFVGNAMASRKRTSAVEELVAEGYGTLTTQAEQRAQGKGVFDGSSWSVVIVMPMRGEHNQPDLGPGDVTMVALAAWDGGAGNRGARKQWSNWISLELEA